MSLDALQARLRQAHADFLAALDGLDASVLEREPAVGSWTPRDVAAHLVDWNAEILLAAEHLLGGPRPGHHPIVDVDAFNAQHAAAAARRGDSWPAVRSRLDKSVDSARQVAARFADRLEDPTDHPWNNHGTIRDLFHGVCGHQEEHTAELRSWRARRG